MNDGTTCSNSKNTMSQVSFSDSIIAAKEKTTLPHVAIVYYSILLHIIEYYNFVWYIGVVLARKASRTG